MLAPDALITAVAGLTTQRDREALDRLAVALLEASVDAREVSIHRCVGKPGHIHLLLRARRQCGSDIVASDPSWTPVDQLPPIDTRPLHARAFATGDAALNQPSLDGRGWVSIFPRRIDADRYGLFEVCSDRALDASELALLDGLLRVYLNHCELLDYSERDTLTGLMNRKTFDERFLKVMAGITKNVGDGNPQTAEDRRLGAEAMPHWLGVIDLDHFKSINDRFGHLIGDEVLLLVAQLLRSSFRYGDRFYRFGGEEFVVVLKAPNRDAAQAAFERFRHAMEAFRFPQAERVTASVGFSALRNGDNASAAIARADAAVYHCKETGRNRVRCHETLVDEGLAERSEEKIGDVELF